jgi:hypothetical protein
LVNAVSSERSELADLVAKLDASSTLTYTAASTA